MVSKKSGSKIRYPLWVDPEVTKKVSQLRGHPKANVFFIEKLHNFLVNTQSSFSFEITFCLYLTLRKNFKNINFRKLFELNEPLFLKIYWKPQINFERTLKYEKKIMHGATSILGETQTFNFWHIQGDI